jgi:hypothetical protein
LSNRRDHRGDRQSLDALARPDVSLEMLESRLRREGLTPSRDEIGRLSDAYTAARRNAGLVTAADAESD